MITFPKFLVAQNPTPERKQLIDSCMGNWLKLAPIMKSLTSDECRYIIRTELSNRGPLSRPEYIYRPLKKIMREYRDQCLREIQDIMEIF